jgi:hypothetical protein
MLLRHDRALTAANLTADDYATTIRTLDRIALNLGWNPTNQSSRD